MPSTFPEAFGMVAAEAAACGALPLSAAHSGLAEVTATLAGALEPELRPLCSFERGPGAVEEIAAKLVTLALAAGAGARARGGRPVRAGAADLRLGGRGRGRDRGGAGPPRRARGARRAQGRLPRGERIVFRAVSSRSQEARAAGRGAFAGLAGAGCGREDEPDLANGKDLFVEKLRLLPCAEPGEHQGRARARTSTRPSAPPAATAWARRPSRAWCCARSPTPARTAACRPTW